MLETIIIRSWDRKVLTERIVIKTEIINRPAERIVERARRVNGCSEGITGEVKKDISLIFVRKV